MERENTEEHSDAAQVSVEGAEPEEIAIARDFTLELRVSVPAGGMTWCTLR